MSTNLISETIDEAIYRTLTPSDNATDQPQVGCVVVDWKDWEQDSISRANWTIIGAPRFAGVGALGAILY